MIFSLKKTTASSVMRPRITPDPGHAAELQRRIRAVTYHPENGFHRDQHQPKQDRPPVKLTLVR